MAGFGTTAPGGGPWAEELDTTAVPVLDPRFTFVGADRMGAWLFEVFLGRLDPSSPYPRELAKGLHADVLSIFHDQATDGVVASWRLRVPPSSAGSVYDWWYWIRTVVRQLPAARIESAYAADSLYPAGEVAIVAATSPALLAQVPFYPPYQAIPPASGAAPLTAGFGSPCVWQQPGR